MFGLEYSWIYPLVTAAAAVVSGMVFLYAADAARLPTWRALLFFAGLAVSVHLGGRLYALIEVYGVSGWRWGDLLLSGYRQPGALGAGLLALPLFWRLLLPQASLGLLGDCLTPGTAFAAGLMRLACFSVGCCFGKVSSLPWAVRFPAGSPAASLHVQMGWLPPSATQSLPVHPLQLYFMLLSLSVGVFVLWFARRKAYDGQVLLVGLVFHQFGKFLLEFLRAPRAIGPTTHLSAVSLTLALLGLAALVGVAVWPRLRGQG